MAQGKADEEEEEEVLFEADPNGQEEEDVLFAASEVESSSEGEEQEEDPQDGVLGPPDGIPLPLLGSTSLPFNAMAAARHVCQASSRGGSESSTVPPQLRRLMWLRWLGVIRGRSPADWLEELRPRRAEFSQLLHEARSPQQAKLRKLIRLDLARCFSEHLRLSCGAARLALRQILEVHLKRCELRGRGEQAYCQGYHELAAVMLLACMDGAWREGEKPDIEEDDLAVYEELCSVDAVPADALALLESLLYDHRLVDMYEPKSLESEEEAAVAVRCRKITTGLQRIAPDVANEVESWGLSPHVLLLRWVRLLFLRELKFPNDVLVAWDVIFADAYRSNEEALATPKLPSSAALPLVDYLALAMVLAVPPTKPEEILHFSTRSPDVRKLLALAWQLRDFNQSAPLQAGPTGPAGPAGRPFPQPPAARYPKLGLQKPPQAKDRRYSIGESLGGEVFGHALGWAASRLTGAFEGVLNDPRTGAPPAEPRRQGFVAAKSPPMQSQRRPSCLEDQKAPAAPMPCHRRPRERQGSEETEGSCWPLSPALSETSTASLSQPRFTCLFNASPHPVAELPPARQAAPQLRSMPFPRAQTQPFWAPMAHDALAEPEPTPEPAEPIEPAEPAAIAKAPKPHEPSAEGVMKDLDALQAMLHSLGGQVPDTGVGTAVLRLESARSAATS